MTMKKTITVTLAALMLMSLCACSEPADTTAVTDAPTEPVTTAEPVTTSAPATTLAPEPVIEKLKVVTYNIQTQSGNPTPISTRSKQVKAVLANYNPDIIGFQEATPEWMKALAKRLTDYASVGLPRTDGVSKGEYSPVFYKKDKFELIETKTFWLSETPDTPSKGWDAAYERICTYAILKDKATGTVIVHMNTHIDHKGTQAKTNQITMLEEYARNNFAADYVILTGDFNVAQDSKNYNIVVSERTIFNDTKKFATATENFATFISTYQKDNTANPIDFIFYNKTKFTPDVYHVMMDKVDDAYPSDHFGVYGEFTLIK